MRKRIGYLSLVLVLLFMGGNVLAQESTGDTSNDGTAGDDSSKAKPFTQKRHKRHRMDPIINTLIYDEYAPTISGDGKTLIFESNRKEGKKWDTYRLWEATKQEDGKWGTPKPIDAINSQAGGGEGESTDAESGESSGSSNGAIVGPFLNYDGTELYFSANFDGNMDIYVAKKNGDEWGAPEKVEGVSSGEYDGFPSVSGDGQRMYFMRKAEGGSEGGDTEAAAEGEEGEGGSNGEERVNCYTLYMAKRTVDGGWAEPTEIEGVLNEDCNRTPRIMADGETFYFSSLRKGAKNGIRVDARDLDLFMSRLGEGAGMNWEDPKPADFANHLSAEASPHIISPDGPTAIMYFDVDMNASHDLYYTLVPEEFAPKKVQEIANCVVDSITGEPLEVQVVVTNETRPDLSYELKSDKETGEYRTLITEGNKYKVELIHEDYITYTYYWDYTDEETLEKSQLNLSRCFPLTRKGVDVNITVLDGDTEEAVDAKIVIKDEDGTSIPQDEVEKKGEGKYFTKLEPKKKYMITATHDGYDDKESELDLMDAKYGDKVDHTVYIYETLNVQFDNVNFATARPYNMNERELLAALDAKARETLDKVAAFLNDYPKVSMNVEAHTDDRGGDDYNMGLSERRAAACVAYLKSKGIAEGRLKAKPFGETKPTVPNNSPENLALNRRVEFKPFRANMR